jgi:methyltransferase
MVTMLDSRVVFTIIVALEAGERIFELVLSARNARRTLGRGGVEHAEPIHWLVVVFHTAWIVAAPLEVWLLDRPLVPGLAAILGVLLIAAMILRYWAVTTLGDRWNTRVITVPGETPVTTGPFKYFRHPNSVAAYVELFALPLLHGAWLTAAVLGTANFILIKIKSRAEDKALGRLTECAGH